jgi:hypothetical protein
MYNRIFVLAALAAGSLASANAGSRALEGKFRGAYVCEKLPTTRDILRVPLDLVVRGNNVQFARPLFNLDGTRVVGSELGAGTIDGDGRLHLTSAWTFLGNIAQAEYTGTLTPTGGTLTGTQTWGGPGGAAPVSRTCTAALVPAPKFSAASEPQ